MVGEDTEGYLEKHKLFNVCRRKGTIVSMEKQGHDLFIILQKQSLQLLYEEAILKFLRL